MSADSMRGRFVRVVTELMDTEPRLALVLADIGVDQFVASGASQRHPLRVVNVGIREQLMVNVAAGMALEGMRTIAHSFAPFLIERSFEQVKLAYSHQGTGGILVSWAAPYDVAAYGRTHQTAADVALVATLPGWRILVPGHVDEAEVLLRDAVKSDDAVYIRLSDQQNTVSQPVNSGRLVTTRQGASGGLTVIAVGPMLDAATEATSALDATVLYASTIRPFDGAGLRAAASGTEVVLVEPCLEGTSAADVSSALADRPHRLLSIGIPRTEHRKYGSAAQHNEAHGLNPASLRERIVEWLGRDRTHPVER